jgi:hypothetical protein
MDLLEVLQQKIEENGGADVAHYTIKDIVLFIISWSIIGGPLLSELYLYIFIKEVVDAHSSNIWTCNTIVICCWYKSLTYF